MGLLTGGEQWYWHSMTGQHRMKDPRTIHGYPEKYWTPDERAYVRHLESHERAEMTRGTDDTPAISALFDLIDNAESIIGKARELIVEMRKAEEDGQQ